MYLISLDHEHVTAYREELNGLLINADDSTTSNIVFTLSSYTKHRKDALVYSVNYSYCWFSFENRKQNVFGTNVVLLRQYYQLHASVL